MQHNPPAKKELDSLNTKAKLTHRFYWSNIVVRPEYILLIGGYTYETFSKLELFYKWKSLWLYMRLLDVKRFFNTEGQLKHGFYWGNPVVPPEYILGRSSLKRAAVYIIRGSWVITRRFMMMFVMRKNYDDVCDEKELWWCLWWGRGWQGGVVWQGAFEILALSKLAESQPLSL